MLRWTTDGASGSPFRPTKFADVLPVCPDCACASSGSPTGLALGTVRIGWPIWIQGSAFREVVRAVTVWAEWRGDTPTKCDILQLRVIDSKVPQIRLKCTVQQSEPELKVVAANRSLRIDFGGGATTSTTKPVRANFETSKLAFSPSFRFFGV